MEAFEETAEPSSQSFFENDIILACESEACSQDKALSLSDSRSISLDVSKVELTGFSSINIEYEITYEEVEINEEYCYDRLNKNLLFSYADDEIVKYVYGNGLISTKTKEIVSTEGSSEATKMLLEKQNETNDRNFKNDKIYGLVYYLYDLRGSVTFVINAIGLVDDKYSYSAYGKRNIEKGKETRLGYCGRDGVLTEVNGLNYMRARYYSPELMRFVNEDIVVGDISRSNSLNRYAYVEGNPVTYVDPLGMEPENGNEYVCKSVLNENGIVVAKGEATRYPQKYVDFLKNYEKHRTNEYGVFILDNRGATIGYGHDLSEAEKLSQIYANGITEAQATNLLIEDLDRKYDILCNRISKINNQGDFYNINVEDFTENELLFLLDFSYNRGVGLFQREKDPKYLSSKSLDVLVLSLVNNDKEKLVQTLQEEVYNTKGIYYTGLELRRIDEYEILFYDDFMRDYDVTRGYK